LRQFKIVKPTRQQGEKQTSLKKTNFCFATLIVQDLPARGRKTEKNKEIP
jgi:hypothetical protein